MKKSRFSESQVVAILKEKEDGLSLNELCRKHGISDQTYYLWKKKYAGGVTPMLDVESYTGGTYILSLLEDGVAVQSEKVVIA